MMWDPIPEPETNPRTLCYAVSVASCMLTLFPRISSSGPQYQVPVVVAVSGRARVKPSEKTTVPGTALMRRAVPVKGPLATSTVAVVVMPEKSRVVLGSPVAAEVIGVVAIFV